MIAGKGFDSQVNSLMPFQIVISIEALRTLVTFEGPIIRNLLLVLLIIVHVLSICSISAVELRHHPMLHITNYWHLTSRTVYVCHNRTLHRRQWVRRIWMTDKMTLWWCVIHRWLSRWRWDARSGRCTGRMRILLDRGWTTIRKIGLLRCGRWRRTSIQSRRRCWFLAHAFWRVHRGGLTCRRHAVLGRHHHIGHGLLMLLKWDSRVRWCRHWNWGLKGW